MGDHNFRSTVNGSVALLEPLGPTPELAAALRRLATLDLNEHPEDAMVGFQRALEIGQASSFATERDAVTFHAIASGWHGIATAVTGDLTGTDEVEQAIVTLTEAGDGSTALSLRINLAILRSNYAAPAEIMPLLEDALAFGRARGLRADLAWLAIEHHPVSVRPR